MKIRLTVIGLLHDAKRFALGEEVTSDQVPAEVLHQAVAGGAELLEADEAAGVQLATDLPGAIAAWLERAGEVRVLFGHALELAEGAGDTGAAQLRDAVRQMQDGSSELSLRVAALFADDDTLSGVEKQSSRVAHNDETAGANPAPAPRDTPPPPGADGDGAGADAPAPEPDASSSPKPKRTARAAADAGEGAGEGEAETAGS